MFAFGLSYILKLCFADTEHSLETGWLVPSAPENVLERLCSVYEGQGCSHAIISSGIVARLPLDGN